MVISCLQITITGLPVNFGNLIVRKVQLFQLGPGHLLPLINVVQDRLSRVAEQDVHQGAQGAPARPQVPQGAPDGAEGGDQGATGDSVQAEVGEALEGQKVEPARRKGRGVELQAHTTRNGSSIHSLELVCDYVAGSDRQVAPRDPERAELTGTIGHVGKVVSYRV